MSKWGDFLNKKKIIIILFVSALIFGGVKLFMFLNMPNDIEMLEAFLKDE